MTTDAPQPPAEHSLGEAAAPVYAPRGAVVRMSAYLGGGGVVLAALLGVTVGGRWAALALALALALAGAYRLTVADGHAVEGLVVRGRILDTAVLWFLALAIAALAITAPGM